MEDDLLCVISFICDHGRTSHLGACPSGCWHGNDGSDARRVRPCPPIFAVLKVPDGPGLAGHEGDGLGCVESGTAAKGNDAVMVATLVDRDAFFNIGRNRVCLQFRKEHG